MAGVWYLIGCFGPFSLRYRKWSLASEDVHRFFESRWFLMKSTPIAFFQMVYVVYQDGEIVVAGLLGDIFRTVLKFWRIVR